MDSRLLTTIIIFPIWLALVIVFRKHRQWLFFYLVGAFGLTLMMVLMAEYFGLDQILVNLISYHVYLTSKFIFHVPIEFLSQGRFLIFYPSGSNVLKLGIECSAILESSILFCLIFFYPLFGPGQKLLRIAFGLVLTYVINIFRLVIIVLMTYKLGSDYIFVAHAGVARIFFFVCELFVYWYLLTKPTVRSVGDSIKNGTNLAQTVKVGRSLQLKHALAQISLILIFAVLVTIGFVKGKEWHKAFEGFAKVKRPIIYQEETEIEPNQLPEKNVLGAQELGKRKIIVPELGPGETYEFKDYIIEDSNLNLQGIEGARSLEIEVYLNHEFKDICTYEGGSTPLLAKPIKAQKRDFLEIKFSNRSEVNSKYEIYLINESKKWQ